MGCLNGYMSDTIGMIIILDSKGINTSYILFANKIARNIIKQKHFGKSKIFCKLTFKFWYRSGTVNSNTVNSKFHLIRSYCEIFFYNFPNIPCLKYTVNSNFHLIRSKTLPTNDFELTVPDLYFSGSVDRLFCYLDYNTNTEPSKSWDMDGL